MKNILAENMLRFRVKNLSAKSKRKLTEQATTVKALEYNLDQMPAILQSTNYTPDPLKYIAIPDGNPWLAANRAVSLKNFLIANVKKQIGYEFDAKSVTIAETAVSPNKGNEYQYVEGTIYGKMSKPPKPQENYPFNIKYNWYSVDGIPYIVNTKPGPGAPLKANASPTEIERLKNQATTITGAKVVKQSTGGGSPTKGPTEYTAGMLIPISSNVHKWVALKNGVMYFKDQDAYNTAKNYIMQYTAEQPGVGAEVDIKKNSTFTDFTSNPGGGGGYILGKLGDAAKATVLVGRGAGNDIDIKQMWVGKSGDVPGETKTGGEGKWVPLGAFQLGKGDGSFLDNMITLQPGSYQKVFDSIKAVIADQLAKDPELDIDSITATIKGYASADRATNRLPKGVTTPDHTYGGHVPTQYWITQ